MLFIAGDKKLAIVIRSVNCFRASRNEDFPRSWFNLFLRTTETRLEHRSAHCKVALLGFFLCMCFLIYKILNTFLNGRGFFWTLCGGNEIVHKELYLFNYN